MYLKMHFATTTVPATSTVFRAWISADNLVLMIFRYGTADPFQCSSFCDVKMERTVTLWNRWTSWHLPVTKNNNNQTHITKLNRIWNIGNCYVVQRCYFVMLRRLLARGSADTQRFTTLVQRNIILQFLILRANSTAIQEPVTDLAQETK